MAAPIRAHDSAEDRISKLLPADVTAAFLSAKAGLVQALGENAAEAVFWTFISILILCPFYFWFVTKAKNYFQVAFLCLTFVVFAISIADTQFIGYLQQYRLLANVGGSINVISTVLPILWAFLISRIFVEAIGSRVERGQ
jgi:hypothetical protein